MASLTAVIYGLSLSSASRPNIEHARNSAHLIVRDARAAAEGGGSTFEFTLPVQETVNP